MSKNKSKLSIVLISIGLIVGYGGILFSGYMFFKTDNNYWVWSGTIPYGVGLVLLSRGTLEKLRDKLKKVFHKESIP